MNLKPVLTPITDVVLVGHIVDTLYAYDPCEVVSLELAHF